jgi:hypothetical protein
MIEHAEETSNLRTTHYPITPTPIAKFVIVQRGITVGASLSWPPRILQSLYAFFKTNKGLDHEGVLSCASKPVYG